MCVMCKECFSDMIKDLDVLLWPKSLWKEFRGSLCPLGCVCVCVCVLCVYLYMCVYVFVLYVCVRVNCFHQIFRCGL